MTKNISKLVNLSSVKFQTISPSSLRNNQGYLKYLAKLRRQVTDAHERLEYGRRRAKIMIEIERERRAVNYQ